MAPITHRSRPGLVTSLSQLVRVLELGSREAMITLSLPYLIACTARCFFSSQVLSVIFSHFQNEKISVIVSSYLP